MEMKAAVNGPNQQAIADMLQASLTETFGQEVRRRQGRQMVSPCATPPPRSR